MTASPQQSAILLKQQLFQVTHQLELLKIQNENLLSEVAESKEKERQLKQLNDMLIQNLHKSQKQVNDKITLNIQGQFLTKRIKQLQNQLQNYRNGVSDSVDRRVKKIVNQYTQQKELQYQKRKSRLSLGTGKQPNRKKEYYETHEHKYYNIEYNTYTDKKSQHNSESRPMSRGESQCTPYDVNAFSKNNCQKCSQLQYQLEQKDQIIQQLQQKLRSINVSTLNQKQSQQGQSSQGGSSQVEDWKRKYLQLLKLYQNLKQQHQRAKDQFSDFNSSQQVSEIESYQITQTPVQGFKKKQLFLTTTPRNTTQSRLYKEQSNREQNNREEVMLKEINNLVNGLGKNRKTQQQSCYKQHAGSYLSDKKSRVSQLSGVSQISGASKVSQQSRLDGSVFTIKEGVNRHGNTNAFF